MNIEVGKWYRAPKGMVYRVNFAETHPISGLFYLEVETIEKIFDYSKRSESTRFEFSDFFFQFYLEKQEKTDQELLNNAYVMCKLLNDTCNEVTLTKDKASLDILNLKFRFKRETKSLRAPSIEAIKRGMAMPDDLNIEISSPY